MSDQFFSLFGRKPLRYSYIDPTLCTDCSWCAKFCPMGCITRHNDGYYVVEEMRCIGCGKCKLNCPSDAVEIRQRSQEEAAL